MRDFDTDVHFAPGVFCALDVRRIEERHGVVVREALEAVVGAAATERRLDGDGVPLPLPPGKVLLDPSMALSMGRCWMDCWKASPLLR